MTHLYSNSVASEARSDGAEPDTFIRPLRTRSPNFSSGKALFKSCVTSSSKTPLENAGELLQLDAARALYGFVLPFACKAIDMVTKLLNLCRCMQGIVKFGSHALA